MSELTLLWDAQLVSKKCSLGGVKKHPTHENWYRIHEAPFYSGKKLKIPKKSNDLLGSHSQEVAKQGLKCFSAQDQTWASCSGSQAHGLSAALGCPCLVPWGNRRSYCDDLVNPECFSRYSSGFPPGLCLTL